MSQISNSPTIEQFKTISQGFGTITQNADNAIVRGDKGAWIRSLFNVGTARQDNRKTIELLKNAINQDEKYKYISKDIVSKLETMSTKLPLSKSKVRHIIGKLDTSIEKIEKNKAQIINSHIIDLEHNGYFKKAVELVEKLICTNANQDKNSTSTSSFEETMKHFCGDNYQDILSNILKNTVAERAKSDNSVFLGKENLVIKAQETLSELYKILLNIENEFKNDEKTISSIYTQIIKDNVIASDKDIDIIKTRAINKRTQDTYVNEHLAQHGIDKQPSTQYDNARYLIHEKLAKLYGKEIPKGINQQALEKIYTSAERKINEEIEDNFTQKNISITTQNISEIITKHTEKYATDLKNLLEMDQSQESLNFWLDLASTERSVISESDINAVNNAAKSTVFENFYNSLILTNKDSINIKDMLRTIAITLITNSYTGGIKQIKELKTHDELTKQDFIEHTIGVYIANQKFKEEELNSIYETLTQGGGIKLYNQLKDEKKNSTNGYTLTVLQSLIYSTGKALGKTDEEIQKTLTSPENKNTNETIGKIDKIEIKKDSSVEENIQIEAKRSIVAGLLQTGLSIVNHDKNDKAQIRNIDFLSHISINGELLQSKSEIESIRNKNIEASIFKKTLDGYAKFLSKADDISKLAADDKTFDKARFMMALFNQNIGKILPAVYNDFTYQQSEAEIPQNISLSTNEDGNISCSITVKTPITAITQKGKTTPLDVSASYKNTNLSFDIDTKILEEILDKGFQQFTENLISQSSSPIKGTVFEKMMAMLSNFNITVTAKVTEQVVPAPDAAQTQTATDTTVNPDAAQTQTVTDTTVKPDVTQDQHIADTAVETGNVNPEQVKTADFTQ